MVRSGGLAPGQIVKLIHRGRSRMLRQVTLTYFIAVPLAAMNRTIRTSQVLQGIMNCQDLQNVLTRFPEYQKHWWQHYV
jgi:hypothetical protein